MNERRKELVKALVELDGSLEGIIKELSEFKWDSPEPLTYVSPKHVVHALKKFLTGTISAQEVEDWADQMQVRDDVAIEPTSHKLVKDALFELGNPSLTRPLSEVSAREWIYLLENSR